MKNVKAEAEKCSKSFKNVFFCIIAKMSQKMTKICKYAQKTSKNDPKNVEKLRN